MNKKNVILLILVMSLPILLSCNGGGKRREIRKTNTNTFEKAQIHFIVGNYEKAKEYYVQITRSDLDKNIIAHAYFKLGYCFLKENSLHQALRSFKNSFLITKEKFLKAYAYEGAGNCMMKLLKFKKAINYFIISLKICPQELNVENIYYKIILCYKKTGDYTKANLYREKLEREFPDSKKIEMTKHLQYFSVQVGAFKNYKHAKNLEKKISSEGFRNVKIIKNKIKKLYCVRVGKLKTLKDAKQESKKLKNKGYKTIIVKDKEK